MIKTASQAAVTSIKNFLKLESSSGLLLVLAAIAAIVLANSPFENSYDDILNMKLTITLGGAGVDKPLLLWINDGLMAVFFLLVGLELKREVVEGQLSSASQVVLPAMAALGGLVVPALIYWFVNQGDSAAMSGWAIPTATDIAFALAVLSLFGDRVPLSLKILLMTIAIIDDLAAILIIAIFYTSDLSTGSLAMAGAGLVVLFALNRLKVQSIAAYMLVGVAIWLFVLKSGVHATLAGVVVAAFIPLKADDDHSPARHLEHILHPWIAFAVLPVFAFANAGVSFSGVTMETLTSGVSLGIMEGLFIGKQLGIFGMMLLAIGTGLAKKPEGTSWGQLYGVAVVCGIGFTMSLFIGSLAFEHGDFALDAAVKIGVIEASLLSAGLGWVVLHFSLPGRGR